MPFDFKKTKECYEKNRNILIFALGVGILAGIWSWYIMPQYSVSLTLTSVRVALEKPLDYNYDNYYALKASDEFGSTISGWFKTPESVNAIFKKAGLEYSPSSFSGFSNQFKTIKVSPTVVEVRFGVSSPSQAEKISQAIKETMTQKNQALSEASKQGLNFVTLAGEPVILKNSWIFLKRALIGFFLGLIFGLFFQSAKKYLK